MPRVRINRFGHLGTPRVKEYDESRPYFVNNLYNTPGDTTNNPGQYLRRTKYLLGQEQESKSDSDLTIRPERDFFLNRTYPQFKQDLDQSRLQFAGEGVDEEREAKTRYETAQQLSREAKQRLLNIENKYEQGKNQPLPKMKFWQRLLYGAAAGLADRKPGEPLEESLGRGLGLGVASAVHPATGESIIKQIRDAHLERQRQEEIGVAARDVAVKESLAEQAEKIYKQTQEDARYKIALAQQKQKERLDAIRYQIEEENKRKAAEIEERVKRSQEALNYARAEQIKSGNDRGNVTGKKSSIVEVAEQFIKNNSRFGMDVSVLDDFGEVQKVNVSLPPGLDHSSAWNMVKQQLAAFPSVQNGLIDTVVRAYFAYKTQYENAENVLKTASNNPSAPNIPRSQSINAGNRPNSQPVKQSSAIGPNGIFKDVFQGKPK